MKFKRGITILTFCILAFATIQVQADQIQDKLNAWMKRNGIPGAAVEVYSNGKRSAYYLGYSDKSTKAPMTPDTIFEIASLTKIFTAVVFADQIQSGAMNLHDPILRYVPDLTASSKNKLNQMTLQNLATHTSGFPFNVPKSINSRQKLANYLSKWKNNAAVGSSWLYSNVNLGLLGYSIEQQSKKSISQLYAEKILQPLGMYSSNSIIPDHLMDNYAQGYNMAGAPAPRRNSEVWLNPPNSDWIFPAAGSLKSTGKDMSLFLKAMLRLPGTPLNIANAAKITQTSYVQTSRFQQGLAWMIHPDPYKNKTKLLTTPTKSGPFPAQFYPVPPRFDGNALMEKTGASGGFRSYIAIIPNQNIGVVLLVNRYISSTELVRMGRTIALNQ